MKRWMILLLACASAMAQTNEPQGGMRLLARRFSDYTILLAAAPGEPWNANWNDEGQMAVFNNPTNNSVITSQYIKYPADMALAEAAGDRDRYLDVALRKYCAVQLARSGDLMVRTQEIKIEGRLFGNNYYRYCSILGHDRRGPRRGYFYITLRGVTSKPRYEGELLIFSVGYPESLPAQDEESVLRTVAVVLQNVSFP